MGMSVLFLHLKDNFRQSWRKMTRHGKGTLTEGLGDEGILVQG